jgi:excisionase family DNA binding protein
MIEATEKKYLTMRECCATLGSSRSFVYKLIRKGLPVYKVGRRTFIRSKDLVAYYEMQQKTLSKFYERSRHRKGQGNSLPANKRAIPKREKWAKDMLILIVQLLSLLKLLAFLISGSM